MTRRPSGGAGGMARPVWVIRGGERNRLVDRFVEEMAVGDVVLMPATSTASSRP